MLERTRTVKARSPQVSKLGADMNHDGQSGCGNRMVTGALPQCVIYLANLLSSVELMSGKSGRQ